MSDSMDILRTARCGSCGGALSETLNLCSLRRRATWEHPVSKNLITGDGPAAIAVLCDGCIERTGPIREVVELREGEIFYHAIDGLEELPPEPTHKIVRAPTGDEGIYCLRCGRVSWHPEDVANLYCGACHAFHPILEGP